MKRHSILGLSLLTASLGAAACDSADSSKNDGDGATAGTSSAGTSNGGAAGTGSGKGGKGGKGGTSDAGGSSGEASGGTTAGSGGDTAAGGTTGGSAGDAPIAGAGGSAAADSGGAAGSTGGTIEAGGTAGSNGGSAGDAPVAGAGGTAGAAGTGAIAGDGGSGGTGRTCDVGSLVVFPRSDTDQSWDDNDFSDVVLASYCPTEVNVTWPHETGWENADPAESNHEQTRFTLDSYLATGDLTGKQVNVTIELTADARGPNANAGGYLVSLVSVSTYDRIVPGGSGGSGGTAGTGEPTTETGYAEAESPGMPLNHVGDSIGFGFVLPNKTSEPDSYDPARVIKVNVRIYSVFSNTASLVAEQAIVALDEGDQDGEGGAAGEGSSSGGTGASGGTGGTAGDGGTGGTGGSGANGGTAGTGAEGGTAGTGGQPPVPVYDYVTSQFAISRFTVTDAQTR